MEDQQLNQEIIETDKYTLVLNGSPSPDACKTFLRLVQEMKVKQKQNKRENE